jgi:hypothetical protein
VFGSEVLDVAIGLVFVYLVLSLICSAACELIESVLKGRASYLKQGMQEMLDDSAGDGLVREIYNHPLVSSLFRGDYKAGQTKNLPSYIPPANFSLALMDIIGLSGPRAGATSSPSTLPVGVPVSPEGFRNAIIANLGSNPHVSQALLALADSAGYNPAVFQKKIEAWYNGSMDRVSGWFKRRSHFVVLTTGLLLSLAINADTISITNSLATDKSLRASLISAATEAAKTPPSAASATSDNFQADVQQIRSAGLPLGWNTSATDLRRVPQTGPEWLFKILGLALTGLAISLGAPFWFDVLNRFMVVRSTVKPSEKSPDEATKS